MELPYQPISEAEAEELCEDLTAVALSFGDSKLVKSIQDSCGGKASTSLAGRRPSDITPLPE
jgi:hypothetical protein